MSARAQYDPVESADLCLWEKWLFGNDAHARDELVAHYTTWSRRLARQVFSRVRGRSTDWPDFVQNASVGLLEAMAHFDPRRGVPFEVYARPRVRGAVFNGLRSLTSGEGRSSAQANADRLESLLDDSIGDPLEQLVQLVSGLGVGVVLGSQVEPELWQASSTPYDEAVKQQLGERLASLLTGLPEREHLVLKLHYIQHLAFVQIAEILEVTKGRVSQIHRAALERLRSRMLDASWREFL